MIQEAKFLAGILLTDILRYRLDRIVWCWARFRFCYYCLTAMCPRHSKPSQIWLYTNIGPYIQVHTDAESQQRSLVTDSCKTSQKLLVIGNRVWYLSSKYALFSPLCISYFQVLKLCTLNKVGSTTLGVSLVFYSTNFLTENEEEKCGTLFRRKWDWVRCSWWSVATWFRPQEQHL